MGRPLTDKWIGPRNQRENPVLTPYCNIRGTEGYCIILRQVGSNKFVVQNISDPTLIGRITLTNGVSSNPGEGYLEWDTDESGGYVSRISDNTIRLFTGGSTSWSVYYNTRSATNAYIVNNSDD